MESLEGFWEDTEQASKIQKEKAILEDVVEVYNGLKTLYDDFNTLVEFAEEDPESAGEAIETYETFIKAFEAAELKVLLSEEMDPNNAIISINAGAGGTESCDWAGMLYRMIIKWCEKKKYKLSQLDYQPGDSAGIKSVTLMARVVMLMVLLKVKRESIGLSESLPSIQMQEDILVLLLYLFRLRLMTILTYKLRIRT